MVGDNMNDAVPEAASLEGRLAALLAGEFGEITADSLRTTFDQWRVLERDGKWWAFRGGEVVQAGPRSLIQPVVGASSLERLAEQLSLQEWLRRMTGEELDAVWREGIAAWCVGTAEAAR
jgi:hypothetical protein